MLSRRNKYLLAVLSGVLLGLAFPPTGLAGGLLAFVALVPLLVALESGARLREAFKIGWVAMFVLGLVSNYWVGGWKSLGEVDPFLMMGGVLLAIVHPFFLIVPWLLYDSVRRRFGRVAALYSLPVFQAGFEYAHSFGDLAYPWLNLYNTQTYNLAYVQFIEISGPYLLSIFIVLVNVEVFQLFFLKRQKGHNGRKWHWGALILLVLLPYLYGAYAINQREDSHASLRVTIVQPNIDPWAKWYTDEQRTLDTNFDATMTALRADHDSTDLMVWPETAITFYITSPGKSYELGELYKFIATSHHALLTGFPDRATYIEGQDSIPPDAVPTGVSGVYYRSWNAAMMVYEDTSGRMHRAAYHKQKLVPLGEHIPFIQLFPFLGKWFQWGVGIGSWNYGEGYEPLKLPLQTPPPFQGGEASPTMRGVVDTLRITPMICYESVYPSFVRHFVDNGANMLSVITNDGWYGTSSGPYQHEQFAVLRAIENRRWVVRCANTGISTFIDDRGRFVQSLPLFISGSITQRVPLIERKTLYVRWGDYIAIPAMIYSIVVLIFAITARIKRRFSKQLAA